jgi:hypothetical protein
MKYPKKYLTSNPNVMKREIKKHGEKSDDDSSAYGPWDADYKSRKAGKGKKVKTKESKYTKKFKDLYDAEEYDFGGSIIGFEEFNHQNLDDNGQENLDEIESSEDSSNQE